MNKYCIYNYLLDFEIEKKIILIYNYVFKIE